MVEKVNVSRHRSAGRIAEPRLDPQPGGHQGRRRRLFRVSHQGESVEIEADLDAQRECFDY